MPHQCTCERVPLEFHAVCGTATGDADRIAPAAAPMRSALHRMVCLIASVGSQQLEASTTTVKTWRPRLRRVPRRWHGQVGMRHDRGTHLERTWHASRASIARTWHAPGTSRARTWHALGMHLARAMRDPGHRASGTHRPPARGRGLKAAKRRSSVPILRRPHHAYLISGCQAEFARIRRLQKP